MFGTLKDSEYYFIRIMRKSDEPVVYEIGDGDQIVVPNNPYYYGRKDWMHSKPWYLEKEFLEEKAFKSKDAAERSARIRVVVCNLNKDNYFTYFNLSKTEKEQWCLQEYKKIKDRFRIAIVTIDEIYADKEKYDGLC